MESIRKHWKSFKKSVREFHTKKPQLEFFTALLTIPVLLTVIILNLNNLKGNQTKTPTKTETIFITQPAEKTETKEVIITKEACKPGIGDISIASPEENESINDNPVTVDINYRPGDYCLVVWSYRINNGSWSSYDDRSIALYNLQSGNIKLELRIKSVVNDDKKTLTRNFIYTGSSTPIPTTTISPSPSQ